MLPVNKADAILAEAEAVMRAAESRDPARIAETLGIAIYDVPFHQQKGVYTVIEDLPCIFVKQDLSPVMRSIVLTHEIGHDRLHRDQAKAFQEFNLFDMKSDILEYEANLFAAHILLPDADVLEYIYAGHDAGYIASAMRSDINLVAIKAADLARRGYPFRDVEHRKNFL